MYQLINLPLTKGLSTFRVLVCDVEGWVCSVEFETSAFTVMTELISFGISCELDDCCLVRAQFPEVGPLPLSCRT